MRDVCAAKASRITIDLSGSGRSRPGLGRAIMHDIGKLGANLAIHEWLARRLGRAGWSDWRRQPDRHAERAAFFNDTASRSFRAPVSDDTQPVPKDFDRLP
jgi:hypothetical protein